jgi:MFS family permease
LVLALLKEKEYRFFISTRFLLTVALQIQAVAIGWEIYSITHDVLSLGLIGLAEAIPALTVALFAGHAADVYNRRNILLFALGTMFLGALGVLYITHPTIRNMYSQTSIVNFLYFFIFLSGVARGFYSPTAFAFLSQIIDRSKLPQASTINSSVWQIAAVAGPASAGFLYADAGISITFIIVSALIGLSFISILRIQSKPVSDLKPSEGMIKSLKAGLSYVYNNKVVLSALSLDMFSVLFGGAVALLPVFADEILHVGPQGLGFLRAAPSLGSALTMIVIAILPQMNKPGSTLIRAVGGFGICMLLFGISTNFYLSLVILFLSGVFDSVSVVVRGNILQLETPDDMRGRVSAVNTIFIGSSNEIGAFESGLAAKLFGTVSSVVFGGCMTMGIVAYTQIKAKKLKEYKF